MSAKELYIKLIRDKVENLINEHEKNEVFIKLFKRDNRQIMKEIQKLKYELNENRNSKTTGNK